MVHLITTFLWVKPYQTNQTMLCNLDYLQKSFDFSRSKLNQPLAKLTIYSLTNDSANQLKPLTIRTIPLNYEFYSHINFAFLHITTGNFSAIGQNDGNNFSIKRFQPLTSLVSFAAHSDKFWKNYTEYLPMAWYPHWSVDGWWRISISVSNSQQDFGSSDGATITMPFLRWDRRT